MKMKVDDVLLVFSYFWLKQKKKEYSDLKKECGLLVNIGPLSWTSLVA